MDLELIGPLSWRANALLSALAVDVSGEIVIAQIERNGLKHGFFAERFLLSSVRQIKWNSIGTLFAVLFDSGQLDLWRS